MQGGDFSPPFFPSLPLDWIWGFVCFSVLFIVNNYIWGLFLALFVFLHPTFLRAKIKPRDHLCVCGYFFALVCHTIFKLVDMAGDRSC